MTRLRWKLARWIAPGPFLHDPFPGQDGVLVLYRQRGLQWSVRADRFRLKSTRNLARLDYDQSRPFDISPPSKAFIRFVGTVAE